MRTNHEKIRTRDVHQAHRNGSRDFGLVSAPSMVVAAIGGCLKTDPRPRGLVRVESDSLVLVRMIVLLRLLVRNA